MANRAVSCAQLLISYGKIVAMARFLVYNQTGRQVALVPQSRLRQYASSCPGWTGYPMGCQKVLGAPLYVKELLSVRWANHGNEKAFILQAAAPVKVLELGTNNEMTYATATATVTGAQQKLALLPIRPKYSRQDVSY